MAFYQIHVYGILFSLSVPVHKVKYGNYENLSRMIQIQIKNRKKTIDESMDRIEHFYSSCVYVASKRLGKLFCKWSWNYTKIHLFKQD